MPNFSQFKTTKKSVAKLRQELLPRRFDPTGNYTAPQRTRAAGYRLLVHAEIEYCLERIAIRAAQRAVEHWKCGKVGLTPITLLTYVSSTKNIFNVSLTPLSSLPDLIEELKSARDNFVHYARSSNMGVRKSNVLRLLLPVGIRESEIDQPWLQQIDEFGQNRGSIAHSPPGRVTQPVDPKGEYEVVTDIIEGIRVIDQALEQMNYKAIG